MTRNQLQYWANQELIRANKAQEAIAREKNQLGWAEHRERTGIEKGKLVLGFLNFIPKAAEAVGSIL